jgi:glycosyltransferase involved in cell wall biosynthesis
VNKVAVVVQRCHQSIVGGSESLAWQYANLLKDEYQAEVLTTTALSTSDWANSLPAGEESRGGVIIRRFPVSIGRTKYWGNLHHRLLEDSRQSPNGPQRPRWPLPLQEEFVRTQGPYSKPLLGFLKERWADYQTIIFVTYLYATSYFGLLQVPRNFALFVPTLHDEEPAYLSLYKQAAHRARSIVWLTPAEQRLGHRLWGELKGDVVGMNIDGERRPPTSAKSPYILYCGRIDPNKGCLELFDYFVRFKRQCPSDLRLVLAGKDDIPVPSHPDIDFRGFVSADEKFSLMAGATALAMPSARESFSIVTLEAMAQGAPVLASDKSAVIADHVTDSGGGFVYGDYEDFANKLLKLVSDQATAKALGARGVKYVGDRYNLSRVRDQLLKVIENCATPLEITST